MGTMAKCVVLLVDDDKRVLRAYSRRLKNVNVITASSVAEALEALSPCPDIVLTDYLMPGRNGLELLVEVEQRCPRARRFLTTGTVDLLPDWATQVAEEIFEKTSGQFNALLKRINAGQLH
jgi:DNA-binding NtrC family response regulator